MLLVTLQNQIRHSRTENGVVSLQCLHCRDQVVGSVGLKNPPSNARLETVPDHLLRVHGGKNQDYLVGIVLQDLSSRVHAIQFWHADVQHKKIRLQTPALLYRIPSVSSLSADFPSFVRPQQRAQTESDYRMIVSHQNAKCTHTPSSYFKINLSSPQSGV